VDVLMTYSALRVMLRGDAKLSFSQLSPVPASSGIA
jgi:hypothetical protein